jgi:predicted RNA-binding Zn-ribbon protein involved in translation (DUF1610 family)
MSDRSAFLCPVCGTETRYAPLSGGREYYCPKCDDNGIYPDKALEGQPLARATLLRDGEAGATVLRAQMNQEIARRRDEARARTKTLRRVRLTSRRVL